MDFNKLKITGFKSFVDKTTLNIENGLTGIVGPNGCGKSNIVDALKWIMGENSAKEMRGKGMDDVIFNGTTIRPRNELAEIELVLDNKKKLAPEIFNNFDTIEVKRKIEREKGSTYYINNKIVRAKDVRLLFADASTGPNTTSIVAQGEVNRLITSNPEERRILLEEAAGITGLHNRRHEAELKLKSTENNLARLEDIIKTHKDQFKILEKQAKEAKKYTLIKDKINSLEITLIKVRCVNNLQKISKKEDRLSEISSDIQKIDNQLEELKNEKNKNLNITNEQSVLINNLKIEKQNHIINKKNLEDEKNRISFQKENLNNRLGQISKDILRENDFLNDAKSTLEKLNRNISNEKKELDIKISNENENKKNKTNFINLKKDLEEGLEKIEKIMAESNELEKEIDESIKLSKNPGIEKIKSNFSSIYQKIKDVIVSFKNVKDDFSNLTNLNKLFNFEEEYNQWNKRINDIQKQIGELLKREKIIKEEIKKLEEKPSFIEQKIQDLDAKINQADNEITQMENKMVVNPDVAKEIDEKIKLNSENKLKKHEEKIRLETDLEYLKNDLNNAYEESQETLSLTLNKEILDKEQINPKDLPAQNILQKELNIEKRKFDNIGPINFKAESEADESQKKIEKMVNEKVDIEKAILKFRESISKINKEGREKMSKTFNGINESFKELFVSFFNGGNAFLKLVGSTDPLQAGLEVFATPPGKKMSTLSLLSGGEKTMTATALILAVFLQNPSPICVLDEVDAPLDDINIEKFCNLVKKINKDTSTKFIIVTHNPISMAYMDRLYGVTMAEKGVSQLISIKLEEAEKLKKVS